MAPFQMLDIFVAKKEREMKGKEERRKKKEMAKFKGILTFLHCSNSFEKKKKSSDYLLTTARGKIYIYILGKANRCVASASQGRATDGIAWPVGGWTAQTEHFQPSRAQRPKTWVAKP